MFNILKTNDQLIIYFYSLGFITLIIHCLLYCVGFLHNKKRLIIVSLGFAICGLFFLIINVIFRVIWNQNSTGRNVFLIVFMFSLIDNNGFFEHYLEEFLPQLMGTFQSFESNVNLSGYYFFFLAIELIYVIYRLKRPSRPYDEQEIRSGIPYGNESLQETKTFKEKDFIFQDSIPEKIYCSNCYELIECSSNFCHSCGIKIKICQICKHPINKKEMATCPFCEVEFHRLEFLEWLKVKACCPACHNEIDLWEFQEFERKKVHSTILYSLGNMRD